MAVWIDRYLKKGRRYQVLDLGSRVSLNQTLTHRQLLADYDVAYVGVDVRKGRNVDMDGEALPDPFQVRHRGCRIERSGLRAHPVAMGLHPGGRARAHAGRLGVSSPLRRAVMCTGSTTVGATTLTRCAHWGA